MSRGNDVFQVLVTNGNQAILAEDGLLEDLQPGQIGFFSYKTNLAVVPTSTNLKQLANNFYMAVGIDRTGNGSIDDIAKSSGTHIQLRNAVSYSGRCYTPAQPKIVELTNFTANCDTEYGVKFEIRNQQAYRVHGYNQVVKTFLVKTDNCTGCEDCPSGDCIALVDALVNEVNADVDNLILAEAIAQVAITIATHGTTADYAVGDVVPATEFAALQAFNVANPTAQVCLGARFTVQAQAFQSYCEINLNYFFPRQTDIILSTIEGFDNNGDIAVTQDIVYEEGSGYDVRQLEYEAGGWNGKPGPYRVSELTGVARNGFEYLSDNAGKYFMLQLGYDQESIAGFIEHKNPQRTVIAIPTADSTTRDEVVAMLDALLNDKFLPLASYAATCPTDGTTIVGSADSSEQFNDSIGTS